VEAQIRRFIECVEAYLASANRYANGEATAILKAQAGQDAPGLNAVLPEWLAAVQAARQVMLDAALELAEALEARNLDSSGVLALRHAADTGEGLSAVASLWPQLKVFLQRITIRAGVRGSVPDENVSERLPQTDDEASVLKPVIADLLRTIPETWTEFDADALTAVQSNALFLLTAAGMVERRGRLRCEMLNHPTYTEETFQATGEGGFAEALDYSTAAMWEVWGESYREWRGKMPEGTPAFRAEALKPQEWRLTAEGVLARGDLDGTNSDANPDAVFDFVLKRGFYGPGHWLRIMAIPELFRKHEQEIRDRINAGQDLHSLPRPPVRGCGRLIEFRKVERPVGSQAVNLTNWDEGADAFSASFGKMLGPMFEAMSKGPQVNASPSAPSPPADGVKQGEGSGGERSESTSETLTGAWRTLRRSLDAYLAVAQNPNAQSRRPRATGRAFPG
jgi:hypothetical protein